MGTSLGRILFLFLSAGNDTSLQAKFVVIIVASTMRNVEETLSTHMETLKLSESSSAPNLAHALQDLDGGVQKPRLCLNY